jgi:hypothetical protein
MTEGHFVARLPPREITPPKNPIRDTVRLYIPGVIIFLILLAVVDRHSAGVVGAALGIGAVALILGIELPLIRRTQRRRQGAMMANLPKGGIYAGQGGLFRTDGQPPRRYADTGTILLDQRGIDFQPKKQDHPPVSIPWSDVMRIQLGPVPGKIGVGRLILSLRNGSARRFSVPNYGALAKALSDHP